MQIRGFKVALAVAAIATLTALGAVLGTEPVGSTATTASNASAPQVVPSKVSPLLAESAAPTVAVDAIVSLGHPATAADIDALTLLGVQVIAVLNDVNALAVTLTPETAALVAQTLDVSYVAADVPVLSTLDVAQQTVQAGSLPRFVSGLTGVGVTVAVLDSGIGNHSDLTGRVLASVDMLLARESARQNGSLFSVDPSKLDGSLQGVVPPSQLPASVGDPLGHGTHCAGIIAGSGAASGGTYRGIAPGANLVSVRVLDENGAGTTSTVVSGLEWVVANKDRYGIRVVSMSLGHPIHEPAHLDALVQAVN